MKTLSETLRPYNRWKAESLSFLHVLLVWGVVPASLLIKMHQRSGCDLIVLIFAIVKIARKEIITPCKQVPRSEFFFHRSQRGPQN